MDSNFKISTFIHSLKFLISAIFIVYITQNYLGYLRSPSPPFEPYGGFSHQSCFLEKKWGTLITYQFIHANIQHLAFNLLSLVVLYFPLKSHLSSLRFITLFLLSGICGALLHYIGYELPVMFEKISGTPTYLVGASGSIMGLLGAACILNPYYDILRPIRHILPLRLTIEKLGIGIMISSLILFSLKYVVRGNTSTNYEIAHLVHLGGLFGGVIFGYIYKKAFINSKINS